VNPGTPQAEISIDADRIRRLLVEQHPDLAGLEIRPFESGWDNAMFRLGDDLVLRFPRREAAAQLVRNEQRCLARLAERLPIPVPTALRIGRPAQGYPWSWSVLPWIPGRPADEAPPGSDQAIPFASFLRALHQPAPDDAPENAVRGVPLAARAEPVEERLVRLRRETNWIGPAVEEAWRSALAARVSQRACWLHGDLHARNTLVENGALSGIIDWGDVTSGDVATDLAGIWALFDEAAARRRALDDYGADDATRRRARGWAVLFGVVLLDSGRVDNPRHAAMGERTLRRIAEDEA
jgi:aminoglycoside phosphotransferase (APT) family kinase protein